MTSDVACRRPVAILADDLSGAAEAASAFLGRLSAPALHLGPADVRFDGVTVVDLNTRALATTHAQNALRSALEAIPSDALVLAKVDSLLRGHVGPWAEVLAERGPVVVAAALPALGRTVRAGVLHVEGVPLHQTRAWHAELSSPPASFADLFADHPTVTTSPTANLADSLRQAAAGGRIAVCDVATDADLDLVLAASRSIPGVQLMGTSALAAAVARTLPTGTDGVAPRRESPLLLTVVGTAEPVAVQQVTELVRTGTRHLALDADDLLDGLADPGDLARALEDGSVVLTVASAVRPDRTDAVSVALARFVAAGQSRRRPDLMLTGGATARAVVDAIGLTTLHPVDQVHHGAVVSVASDGRTVVTRPGSFGDLFSLTDIARHLAEPLTVRTQPKALT
ncbi:4-hydroxythreonine-4-phosphate dehydrogenase [Mycobacterium yunnanensis]|uniref:4-hydroxythreonine-4-phosphate dehydrogenase n=1 Tax=Mycobacterium yunnanensis TaxID=368477 RepID=A0A9X2ZA93_9MYCO|nr:four-carbon acid sugar kinase family protein [Mycobacterium yunnanensis]MCV7424406.1 4-hydroxythreonine-4-phosphate dehydrogenase [Mycobacterium yunnanensis]